MYHLVKKQKGLFSMQLYQGETKDNYRDGFGLQVFPNGSYYIGFWKKNKAHGFGRLCFKDGTYYEGVYSRNMIKNGKLVYCNGAVFDGEFDKTPYDRFQNGTFNFKNGYKFKGEWSQGYPTNGELYDNNSMLIKMEKSDSLLSGSDSDRGVIISKKNKWMYEGGINKQNQCDGDGFIYCTFQQYKFGQFKNDKMTGQCYKMSINWGEISEGESLKDKKVGKWKKLLNNGYLIIQDESEKKVEVRFPYLFNDHYIGTLGTTGQKSNSNIIFKQGVYYLFRNTFTETKIELTNVDSVFSIPQVANRSLNFQFTFGKIMENDKVKIDFYKFMDKINQSKEVVFENDLQFFQMFIRSNRNSRHSLNQKKSKIIKDEKKLQKSIIDKFYEGQKSHRPVSQRKHLAQDLSRSQIETSLEKNNSSLKTSHMQSKDQSSRNVFKDNMLKSNRNLKAKQKPKFKIPRNKTPRVSRNISPINKTHVKTQKSQRDTSKSHVSKDYRSHKHQKSQRKHPNPLQYQEFYNFKNINDVIKSAKLKLSNKIESFQGTIYEGQKNGFCKLAQKDGLIKIGFFKNDYIEEGYQERNGFIYKGQFQNGLLEGKGQLCINDKTYNGNFDNGEFSSKNVVTRKTYLHMIFKDVVDKENLYGDLDIHFANNFILKNCYMKNGFLQKKECCMVDPFKNNTIGQIIYKNQKPYFQTLNRPLKIFEIDLLEYGTLNFVKNFQLDQFSLSEFNFVKSLSSIQCTSQDQLNNCQSYYIYYLLSSLKGSFIFQ